MPLPSEKKTATEKELDAKFRALEAEVVASGLSPADFLRIFRKKLLATPDPERALNNFLRFISSGFTSSLLRNFSSNPIFLEIALTLFSHSQYLADILVRNPELFHWLTATTAVTDSRAQEDYYRDALTAIAPFEQIEKKLDALKRFHRREILKISTRDILKEADLSAITHELSWLADSIVDATLHIGKQDLNRRLQNDFESTLTVIALGKLGGMELNFSSDIDLMFVYDTDGDLDYGVERIHSYHEYYCRLAEFVVRRLSENTNEGHLYRIDMRLRPDGGVGPLAMARNSYVQYYESRGELWERQMLLKARISAGNREVGERFLKDLRPFVYPKTVLRDPREEISAIKRRIEANAGTDRNVKLSKGGIRDIEFVVQALQLLGSNRDRELKEPNTLAAIEMLSRASMLKHAEAHRLRLGYVFLRQVEHRLQLLHGTQTHELPVSEEEVRLLAKRLGFGSMSLFKKELKRVQGEVRAIYDSVFLADRSRDRKQATSNSLTSGRHDLTLSRAGFLDPKLAFESIKSVRKELVLLENPTVLQQLLTQLRRSGAPDYGLRNFRVLSSSQSLQRTFDQVMTNDRMRDLLITVCSRSSRLTQVLAREPLLFESLLGRTEDFFKPEIEWGFLLKSDPVRFRLFNESKVMIRYLTVTSTIEQATREISEIADAVVESIVQDLLDKFPEFSEESLIIALGKYGGEELLTGSDLDMLILVQNKRQPNASNGLDEAAIEFVRSFSTGSGQIYDVDLRLRPEGKSAPLTAELSYYRQYLSERAEIWEKQALLKARCLHGKQDLVENFESLRDSALRSVGSTKRWTDQISEMKGRMERERTDEQTRKIDLKIGNGGLIDLEFLIQATQLKHYSSNASIAVGNSFEAIDRLSTFQYLTKRDAAVLKRNYRFLRQLELSVRLTTESNQFVLSGDKAVLQAIAASLGARTAGDLKERVAKMRIENRRLMKKVFTAIKR